MKLTIIALLVLLFSGTVFAAPAVGTSTRAYFIQGHGVETSLTTPAITTTSGSMIFVQVGCGATNNLPTVPTDSKGNTYYRLGNVEVYGTIWPESGTCVYYATNITGGASHTFTKTCAVNDELTVIVVEVTGASYIANWAFNYPSANPETSSTVTATDAAVMVAFWAGDAASQSDVTVASGFTIQQAKKASEPPDNSTSYVQGAIATRVVTAGDYSVTWTGSADQGALLRLVAAQGPAEPAGPITNLVVSGKLNLSGRVNLN